MPMCTMLVPHRVIHGQMAPQDIRYILRSEPRHGDIFFSFIRRKIIKSYLLLISLVYLHKDNWELSHFYFSSLSAQRQLRAISLCRLSRDRPPTLPGSGAPSNCPSCCRRVHTGCITICVFLLSLSLTFVFVLDFCLCICIRRNWRDILKCR